MATVSYWIVDISLGWMPIKIEWYFLFWRVKKTIEKYELQSAIDDNLFKSPDDMVNAAVKFLKNFDPKIYFKIKLLGFMKLNFLRKLLLFLGLNTMYSCSSDVSAATTSSVSTPILTNYSYNNMEIQTMDLINN